MDRERIPYGLGAVGLGVIGLLSADFALNWQPVPRELPFRETLAYLSAAWVLAGGFAILLPRTSRAGALALAALFALWVLLAHGPQVAARPANLAAWLGVAEIGALTLAGLIAAQPGTAAVARRLFGLCCLVFGASHFVYAQVTASMVPPWLPQPLFWAYLTGAGHLAAGVALLSGVIARLATALLAAMFAVFVLALHLPRVIATPDSRPEWTMLCVALALTGAALIVWRSFERP